MEDSDDLSSLHLQVASIPDDSADLLEKMQCQNQAQLLWVPA